MKNMITTTAFIAATLSLQPLAAQERSNTLIQEKPITNIDQVKAQLQAGSITVVHQQGETPMVQVYASGPYKSTYSADEIKAMVAEQYDVSINTTGQKLEIIARRKVKMDDWKKAVTVSVKVITAAAVNTELKTDGGSILLRGINGTHTM